MKKLLFALALLSLTLSLSCALAEGSVSGAAFLDSSLDGIRQESERGLGKTAVRLEKMNGNALETIGTQYTETDGAYSFTGLQAGTYRLSAVLPDNYTFSIPAVGGSAILPACGTESVSPWFELTENEALLKDVGASKNSPYLIVYTFEDENENGGRGNKEAVLRGVKCDLYYTFEGVDYKIASADSTKEGFAAFRELTPGTYFIKCELPAPYAVTKLGADFSRFYNCFTSTGDNLGQCAPFEVAAKGSVGVALGGVKTGSLSGQIWDDSDMSGKREGSEGGFAGATVALYNELSGVSSVAVTDESGAYGFTYLQPGEYSLSVNLPEGKMFTLGDSWFNDGAQTQTGSVTAVAEKETVVPAIGVMPATSLRVSFFLDIDADGLKTEADKPLPGASVTLLRGGEELASAISDASGDAVIPAFRGGETAVRCALPGGYIFTLPAEGGGDFAFGTGTESMELSFDCKEGQETALLAGATLPATISGQIFADDNLSGVHDAGEGMLQGFTVQAVDEQGNVVAETVTDESGAYAFTLLSPKGHTVRFLLHDAYIFSDFSNTGASMECKVAVQYSLYGESLNIPLAPGQIVTRVDAGAFKAGVVTGYVLQEDGAGLSGVTVELTDEEGAPYSDHTWAETDETGLYIVRGALPGDYCLRYTLPDGIAYLDGAGREKYTEPFAVAMGEEKQMPELFAVRTSFLYGVIFRDNDGDGVQGQSEEGLANIVITLSAGDEGVSYEARTDAYGAFAFSEMLPGTYSISLQLDEGLSLTGEGGAPVPASATGAGAGEITLAPGESRYGCNMAVMQAGALSGVMFEDFDNDGVMSGDDAPIAGASLTLTSSAGVTVGLTTDEDGAFSRDPLTPGHYVLTLTLDKDRALLHTDKAQSYGGVWSFPVTVTDGESKEILLPVLKYGSISGEVWSLDGAGGLSGYTVTLLSEAGDEVSSAISDQSGAYTFTGLLPGTYTLSCPIPDGAGYARARDAENRASYIQSGGEQLPITLVMGDEMTGIDIGVGSMGEIGDFAFLDENGNGLQDGGEMGVPGVSVELYQYGELAASAVTDAYGMYKIINLYPGSYTLVATPPKELKATARNTDFPLAGNILNATDDESATAENVIVPSGGKNLNCDLGFVARKNGVLPDSMQNPPQTDWTPKE